MDTRPRLAALASAAVLLGISVSAQADHNDRRASNDRAMYDYAQVVSAQPIIDGA